MEVLEADHGLEERVRGEKNWEGTLQILRLRFCVEFMHLTQVSVGFMHIPSTS